MALWRESEYAVVVYLHPDDPAQTGPETLATGTTFFTVPFMPAHIITQKNHGYDCKLASY